MRRYLARRLMLVIPTVLGVTMIIFIAMRLLPGDPLVAIFGLEGARRMTTEQRANLEQALGLRDPFVVQYGKWLGRVMQDKGYLTQLQIEVILDIQRVNLADRRQKRESGRLFGQLASTSYAPKMSWPPFSPGTAAKRGAAGRC